MTRVQFTADSGRLMAASRDGTLRLWDLSVDASALLLAYDHDDGRANWDSNFWAWRFSRIDPRETGESFSPDGKLSIRPGGPDAWAAENLPRLFGTALPPAQPGGAVLTRGSLATPVPLWSGRKHLVASRFSGDGRRAATFDGRCVEIWDLSRGKRVGRPLDMDEETSLLPALFLNADGTRVAALFCQRYETSQFKTTKIAAAYVWDVQSGPSLAADPFQGALRSARLCRCGRPGHHSRRGR